MKKQYSIVSYLEGVEYERVRTLQRALFERTGSRACLDDWEPHLTVGSGVWVSDEERAEVEDALTRIAADTKPFSVALKGFRGRADRIVRAERARLLLRMSWN